MFYYEALIMNINNQRPVSLALIKSKINSKECIDNNDMVMKVMLEFSDILKPNGLMIYSCRPISKNEYNHNTKGFDDNDIIQVLDLRIPGNIEKCIRKYGKHNSYKYDSSDNDNVS